MAYYADNFASFSSLNANTPEIDVQHNIVFMFESEDDIAALILSDPAIDRATFKLRLREWFNALAANGATAFAVVKPGRRGGDGATVDANADEVTLVRDVYDEIMAERSDCYDVFPDLIERPTPFVLDNLITYDDDGSWVSGQANDGTVHYTSAAI